MGHIPKVISITSGKGGVGKTNLSVNIALKIQERGNRVLILDADLGLANVNVLFNITTKKNINDLVSGKASIEEILVEGPGGVHILPASSGIFSSINLSDQDHMRLIGYLESLNDKFDYIIIDTAAGIGGDVLFFNSISHFVTVVVTQEPTSITDAYAVIKVLNKESKIKDFKIIINQVASSTEGKMIYNSLYKVASQFLNVSLEYLGHVVSDKIMTKSVLAQIPVTIYSPQAPVSLCIDSIANRMLDRFNKIPQTGNVQLFWEKMVKDANF
ncbi:MinD/ParA family protein [bacterium]|nr:MinD/ParA family protein [bacterium]